MDPSPSLPAWVRAAATRPLAFAQVREDPLIDRFVVERRATELARPVEVVQIASGGCTAALLASLPQVARLHLVDPNPAQIALSRLKCWLLEHAEPAERLAVLGHSDLPAADRDRALVHACAALGIAHAWMPGEGPDHCGRYELLFAELRRVLAPHAERIDHLLTLAEPVEQTRLAERGTPLGTALDEAFTGVLALDHLVLLFGAAATRGAMMPFSEHFLQRLRWVLAAMPAGTNPFVWQVLAGRYPPGHPATWIALPRGALSARITWTVAMMDKALARMDADCDVVHLSNILDWLSPEDATRTLALAWQALRPGGLVLIRQLNSSLDIPALGSRFAWEDATALLARDRSFFYRALHLGRKS